MKYFFFVLLSVILLLFSSCNEKIADEVFGKTWLYSFEENDKEKDLSAYRDKDYPFPPARMRNGFIVEKDGTFKYLGIAPTDGREIREGTWKETDQKNKIEVIIKPKKGQTFSVHRFSMEFVSLDDGKLMVKEVSMNK